MPLSSRSTNARSLPGWICGITVPRGSSGATAAAGRRNSRSPCLPITSANRVLAVEEIKAANGGRLKFKGKIDRGSVPKNALRNNGAGGAAAKTLAAH